MSKQDRRREDQVQDDQNTGTAAASDQQDAGITVDQRPSETHNSVSHSEGDKWSENKVSTSLDED